MVSSRTWYDINHGTVLMKVCRSKCEKMLLFPLSGNLII